MSKKWFFLALMITILSLVGCQVNGKISPEVERVEPSVESIKNKNDTKPSQSSSANSPSDSSVSSQDIPKTAEPSAPIETPAQPQSSNSTISSSDFYNVSGDYSAVISNGSGRIVLTGEKGKEFFSGIDFSQLKASSENYDMGVYGVDTSSSFIMFMNTFGYPELRLDKNKGIAVFETSGQRYYYTVQADFFDTINARIGNFEKFSLDSLVEPSTAETTDDGAVLENPVTG